MSNNMKTVGNIERHTDAIRATIEAFNRTVSEAEADGVRVRYKKSEVHKGGWNGPLVLEEIAYVSYRASQEPQF